MGEGRNVDNYSCSKEPETAGTSESVRILVMNEIIMRIESLVLNCQDICVKKFCYN